MVDLVDFFNQYGKFVNGVTSSTSLSFDEFKQRIETLESTGLNFAKMDTAVAGIAGESGEIADLWKKIKFHGKPWDADNRQKMISECSDMFWYLSHLMECLDVTPEEVILYNIEKLQARYPGGKFSIERSENRTS